MRNTEKMNYLIKDFRVAQLKLEEAVSGQNLGKAGIYTERLKQIHFQMATLIKEMLPKDA